MEVRDLKTVIVAGGKGTRIASVASGIPKPMIPVEGIPVLEREVLSLRDQGFSDIIITVNYLSSVITGYFGDGNRLSPTTGLPFNVSIRYYIEEKPLGTAGALFNLRESLTDDFLLLNADVMFDIDLNRFVAAHHRNQALATIVTHPNDHPYDSSLIIADDDGRVLKWLSKEEPRPEFYHNRVNSGIHILSPRVFNNPKATSKVDLDRDVLKSLINSGGLYSYDSPEYIKDMGTPTRYGEVCEDFAAGRIAAKNLKNKQRAVFLDRDGTINESMGFLRSADEFSLLPGVAAAIRLINKSGYLAIVVTNQPIVARGEVTIDELRVIHNKMETELGKEGAYIDALYYCPHHPDKGFSGEVTNLKIDCDCRKPKPGMLLKAANDFNIDLSRSWMIGDSMNDMLAGKSAGCKCVMISINHKDSDQYIASNSLVGAVRRVLEDGYEEWHKCLSI